MNNKKYNIPEKITNLIFDFDKFISYIEEEKIVLTSKNHYLKRKDLHEINKIMSEPQKDVTKNNDQPRYVRLNLFYYLGLAGNLFRKRGSEEGKQVRLIINENIYNEFKNLNLVEKYFSLLKIFWVDTDWKKLQTGYYNDSPINTVSDVINIVANKAKSKIKVPSGSRLIQLLYNWNAFLKYFEFFGLWEVVEGETEFKNSYKAEAIKTTDLGNKILNILNTNRSIMKWNKHVSENDRKNDFTDMILNRFLSQFDEHKNKSQDRVNKNDNNYEDREEFFLPFVDLFFEYQVGKILSEKDIEFFKGNIVFKVELTKKCG